MTCASCSTQGWTAAAYRPLRVLCALAGLLLGSAAMAAAQESDALVVPRGTVSLRASGIFTHYDTRFAAAGGTEREPLAADFNRPLTGANFAPLRPLGPELNRFFDFSATQGAEPPLEVGSEELQLGTPDLALAVDVRRVPITLEAGVFRRVSVSASVPVVRTRVDVLRFGMAGGEVGLNPDPAFNRNVLSRLDAELAALGESGLLPTAGSTLGAELQRRVRALTANQDSLRLPAAPLDAAGLQQLLGEAPLEAAALAPIENFWHAGDATVGVKVQLLNSAGEAPYPPAGIGTMYRSTAIVEGRLPTGLARDPANLHDLTPEGGHRGVSVQLANDLFVGDRFWASGSIRYSALLARRIERRVRTPDQPWAPGDALRTLDWNPGNRLEIELLPRARLAEAISLGLLYRYSRWGEDAYTYRGGDPLLDPDGDPVPASVLAIGTQGSVQELGARIAFTTLPAFATGVSPVPYELALSFRSAFTGTAGMPAYRTAAVEGRIFVPIWGR